MISPDRETFRSIARPGTLVPLHRRIMSDQLTPVLAYRRLVAPDERTAPSFLFESVETGGRQGRYSLLGARPSVEVLAIGCDVEVIDHGRAATERFRRDNPLDVMRELTADRQPAPRDADDGPPLPEAFLGGWVGYAGYDTVRYLEPEKLPFDAAPPDDRNLPDLHFALYPRVIVFDHVDKVAHVIAHVPVDEGDDPDALYDRECAALDDLVRELETPSVPLPSGSIDLDLAASPAPPGTGNFSRDDFERAVERTKEHIAAGDAFQIVISQRFERSTNADPFDIYRALRVVNPSPYMIYLQAKGSILVASSPEILCRVRGREVINRPLAGTRKRGRGPEEDHALERDLLADQKERAEHIMLVDLARNDLGRVCDIGSIDLPRIMEIERYSHVMHISSTVTGRLRDDLTAWDALRATLPVGTVSGAPKVRAMQIIDSLEPTRRGPYGGGIGAVGFDGNMDIALTLRTMVIPTARAGPPWRVHLQAGAGVVADSVPANEYQETVNKAAALGRAIDLAESAFGV